MRIRSQFRITLALFAVALTVIATITVATATMAERARIQENLSNAVAQGASDLSYLSNDYVIYRESQQLNRWLSRYEDFSTDVENLNPNNPEQHALVRNIEASQQRAKEVFNSIVSALGDNSSEYSTNESLATFQVSWSRMAIQTQGLTSDASHLALLLHNEADQLTTITFILIFGIVGTFCAFLIVIYVQTFRRTLKSLSTLQAGTAIIGSGKLEYRVEEDRDDEIGDLSKAFNRMTANLKTLTASKKDLEKEIGERMRTEEKLQITADIARKRAEELEELQVKLEEKAAELEEYATKMEQLAEQRLKQLKDSERLAAIGQTAGMVGHDIRNPLQSILSELFLAKTETASIRQKDIKQNLTESITNIENDIYYINKIIADLQDFARTLKPQREQVDPRRLLKEVQSSVRMDNTIQVSVQVDDNIKTIDSDPAILKRVLTNLMQNAVQAMPGGGQISVRAAKKTRNIVFEVEDNGEGIPDEVKAKIFSPLFTTKSKGQGFGLAVVKRMTEALGGTVTFDSQVGRGTIFTVQLPE